MSKSPTQEELAKLLFHALNGADWIETIEEKTSMFPPHHPWLQIMTKDGRFLHIEITGDE